MMTLDESQGAGPGEEPIGVRDVLAQINKRFEDLRSDMNARFALMTGLLLAVIGLLAALLARGG